MGGQDELRELIFQNNHPRSVDWKLVMERARNLERREEQLLEEMQLAAELRYQRECKNRSIRWYEKYRRSRDEEFMSTNQRGCPHGEERRRRAASETEGSNSSTSNSITEWSSTPTATNGETRDDTSKRRTWKKQQGHVAVPQNSRAAKKSPDVKLPKYSLLASGGF